LPAVDASFSRSVRLLEGSAYKRVFSKPKKSADACFTVLWRSNDTGKARLGLAISKKSVRRAVDRNRIKRLIRDSFRLIQHQLPAVDLIVMSRTGAAERSNQEIYLLLQRHWKKIILNG